MIPLGNHKDWIWPLKYIPRRLTAFYSKIKPRKLAGNAPGHLDVPAPGTWAIMGFGWFPVMWAYTWKNGHKSRVGALRYDYEDDYWEVFTLRLF